MAQIRICDRCKNEIDEVNPWYKVTLGRAMPTSNTKKIYDLCPDCYDAFIEFIFEPKDACIHFVDERKEI